MKSCSFGGGGQDESINVANVFMLLSQDGHIEDGDYMAHSYASTSSSERVFECKTCKRQFPSFQALGGHRASHKKPRLAGGDGAGQGQAHRGATKPRLHECSVCGLEFAIGQGLGGHMRRHRAAVEGLIAKHGIGHKKLRGDGDSRGRMLLDLNLPPLENDLKLGIGLEIVDNIPIVRCLH